MRPRRLPPQQADKRPAIFTDEMAGPLRKLKLRDLDGRSPMDQERDGACNPHLAVCRSQLQEVWSGAFDITDTVLVLRREAERLAALADAIEKNDS